MKRRSPTWIWVGLWVVVSGLAWALAFTFWPSEPFKFTLKILHVVVFFAWSIATIEMLRCLTRRSFGLVWELGVCLIAAGGIELLEYWVPKHEPDWIGFWCSCLGVALAGWLIRRSDGLSSDRDDGGVSEVQ